MSYPSLIEQVFHTECYKAPCRLRICVVFGTSTLHSPYGLDMPKGLQLVCKTGFRLSSIHMTRTVDTQGHKYAIVEQHSIAKGEKLVSNSK